MILDKISDNPYSALHRENFDDPDQFFFASWVLWLDFCPTST